MELDKKRVAWHHECSTGNLGIVFKLAKGYCMLLTFTLIFIYVFEVFFWSNSIPYVLFFYQICLKIQKIPYILSPSFSPLLRSPLSRLYSPLSLSSLAEMREREESRDEKEREMEDIFSILEHI